MSTNHPKRFYKTASVERVEDGWIVTLDGRPIRTPAKVHLSLPTEALAREIAAEWDAQVDVIAPHMMPLTRLANVVIDRTPLAREELADEVAKYAETDTICHLEDSHQILRARQEEHWRPWRDWAGRSLGIMLVPVDGIATGLQPQASLDSARKHAIEMDDYRLTATAWACGLFGSCVLALAVERGAIDAATAFDVSRIEEDWQVELWGADDEATASTDARRLEALALGRWFDALRA